VRLPELPPTLRLAAAAAVLVLAGTSRGDSLVLGVLVVLLAGRPTALVAVGGAFVASAWRWGDSSLEALAGAQAVLGPAGGVGPAPAAAGAWLAAAALVAAAARRPHPLEAAALGAAAAAVLAGPAPGGDLPVRVIVALGVAGASFGLGHLRASRPRVDRPVGWLGAVLGLGALAAVAPDAPAWPPRVALDPVVEGALLALAAGVAVLAGALALQRARWRTPGVPPIVARPRAGLSARGDRPR
jgi:hypothetical protein